MFKITIHPDADGGPDHLLHLLSGMTVAFKIRGTLVVEGVIEDTVEDDVGNQYVIVATEQVTGTWVRVRLNIWTDFDEVQYL